MSSWKDIGNATNNIREKGLPEHGDLRKNWDLWQLHENVSNFDDNITIFDFGCSGLFALNFLSEMGFKNLYGIDLYPLSTYIEDLAFLVKKKIKNRNTPKISRGNALNNNFPNGFFDLTVSISVIEHGVPLKQFFSEVSRILKEDGLLFITTDYWPQKIKSPSKRHIFYYDEIIKMINIAKECGFNPCFDSIPDSKNRVIFCRGRWYTFLCTTFKKGLEG